MRTAWLGRMLPLAIVVTAVLSFVPLEAWRANEVHPTRSLLSAVSPSQPWAFSATARPLQSTRSPERSHLNATPLSVRELTERADRIFVGSVKHIETLRATDPDLRTVTFRVTKVLKGDGREGILKIKQYTPLSPALREGEEVLWYLPNPSRIGLASPIGLLSGSFRLTQESTNHHVKLALNDANNEALWAAGMTLWESYSYTSEQLRTALGSVPEFSSYRSSRLERVLAAGSKKPQAGVAVPLDLLIAVAHLHRMKHQ